MDESNLDSEILNEFQENDEWEACFNAVEEWDREQDLIAKSNALDDEQTPRKEYLEVLQRCFGHKTFRPMQWKIISSIINDKRDNCAIMATGYGKSLCFQYPSVYIGGVTIVVSPLISLMEDQVLSLTMSNIGACLLGSAQNNKRQVLDDIFDNKYSLIYLTPEFCCGDYGQDLLKQMHQNLSIILIAIDEAHCVSSWGHDFRYQYRELGKLRRILPNVPILAVTATATPKVRSDIISCLNLRNPQILCSGFDRPNLEFSVYLKGNTGLFPDLRKVMTDKSKSWGFPGSTIIYCITRKQTEEVADILQAKGVKCLAYHAGLPIKQRKDAHELFVRDKIKVIVATIAFGMGIDKPDVRNIIHYGASKDIESYYQEVGRAGRDGQPSICVTFYRPADFDLHQNIREMSGTSDVNRARRDGMEKIMLQYLETRDCRRQFILNHFEGSVTPKKPKPKCCDNCTRKLSQTVSDSNKYEGLDEHGLYDFTKDTLTFLNAVEAMGGKFGIGMYILLIRGSKSTKLYSSYQKHPLYGSGKYQNEEWWKCIGRLLERENYLKKTVPNNRFKSKKTFSFGTYSVSDKGKQFIQDMKQEPTATKKILFQPTPEMFQLLKHKHTELPEEQLFTTNPLPSTSTSIPHRVSKNPKPSLKLLKVKGSSDSKSETRSMSDNSSETSETDVERDERMKVYRLLMSKRTDLASAADCMPYMVASNEALMKMAQVKPLTIKELRECQLDGFTEAKISRFGEEFVKTIRTICQLDPIVMEKDNKKTIQDILAENPLPGSRIGATAEASYSMYKSGLTVQEIGDKRGLVASTVFSHLVDAIKVGYPIKMIDLNITDETRDIVVNAIRNPPINSDMSKLTRIKEVCPPEVSFDTIKVVIAFLQVRDYLARLNIPYEDFESPLENVVPQQSTTYKQAPSDSINHSSSSQAIRKLSMNSNLSFTRKNEKRDAESDSSDSFVFSYKSSNVNQPKKKQKRCTSPVGNLDFLDSPPRTSTQESKKSRQDDLAFLDSPPRSSQLTCKKSVPMEENLEKSLLEDDFFDDIEFDDVENHIRQATDSASIMLNRQSENIQSSRNSISVYESPTTNKLVNTSAVSSEEKNKFKKFQFKSKVPLSVEQSTRQLCSRLSSQHSNT
ncbi:hypothetical protein ILUMI_01445 [Ignelater luminosus]|uniref:DNA 3'-5' helicase n=1 Tax=Ignelater luminosus TaxID=2038154 RepID=A0A8K0DEE0_IGNLU|nr:hypothetical protein ILUMI_01445 [Ignelater luminosus]